VHHGAKTRWPWATAYAVQLEEGPAFASLIAADGRSGVPCEVRRLTLRRRAKAASGCASARAKVCSQFDGSPLGAAVLYL
jgi:hypothetical protein